MTKEETTGWGASMGDTPERRLVEAIWRRWARDLDDWDLEGSTANEQAYRLAVAALAEALDDGRAA